MSANLLNNAPLTGGDGSPQSVPCCWTPLSPGNINTTTERYSQAGASISYGKLSVSGTSQGGFSQSVSTIQPGTYTFSVRYFGQWPPTGNGSILRVSLSSKDGSGSVINYVDAKADNVQYLPHPPSADSQNWALLSTPQFAVDANIATLEVTIFLEAQNPNEGNAVGLTDAELTL